MRTSYRLVLIIGSLVMLALAMFFLSLLMGRDPVGLTEVITGGEEMNLYRLIGFGLFVLLFLLLFLTGLSGETSPRTVIHETEMGEVRIAFSAVESLALRAIEDPRRERGHSVRGGRERRAPVCGGNCQQPGSEPSPVDQ